MKLQSEKTCPSRVGTCRSTKPIQGGKVRGRSLVIDNVRFQNKRSGKHYHSKFVEWDKLLFLTPSKDGVRVAWRLSYAVYNRNKNGKLGWRFGQSCTMMSKQDLDGLAKAAARKPNFFNPRFKKAEPK